MAKLGYRDFPILLYHNVGKELSRLTVSSAMFDAQMSLLKRKGFIGVPLEVAIQSQAESFGKQKPIALTFDDGFAGILSNALPILDKHGFAGTVFIAPDFIDSEHLLEGLETMDWEQVSRLLDHGWFVGAHTCSHSVLTELSVNSSKKEIVDSKSIIEKRIGREVLTFAYPKGCMNQRIRTIVRSAGYIAACTIWLPNGMNEDIWSLQRIGINEYNPLWHFNLKISFPYRWLLKHKLANLVSRRRID